MHFEASSSPPATDISPINAAADDKKRSRRDSTGHPLYGGGRRSSGRKWARDIREPNKRSRMAAAAKLNFPESAHRLPAAASSARADMQRATLEAAREFSGPASSPSTLTVSNNGGDSVSIFVDKESGDVPAGDGGGLGRAEFADDEAIFNMPLLLDSMAEGMLLTPPSMKKGFSWSSHEYDDDTLELTLWKH